MKFHPACSIAIALLAMAPAQGQLRFLSGNLVVENRSPSPQWERLAAPPPDGAEPQ